MRSHGASEGSTAKEAVESANTDFFAPRPRFLFNEAPTAHIPDFMNLETEIYFSSEQFFIQNVLAEVIRTQKKVEPTPV